MGMGSQGSGTTVVFFPSIRSIIHKTRILSSIFLCQEKRKFPCRRRLILRLPGKGQGSTKGRQVDRDGLGRKKRVEKKAQGVRSIATVELNEPPDSG